MVQVIPSDTAVEIGSAFLPVAEQLPAAAGPVQQRDWWARCVDDGWLDAGPTLSLLDLCHLAEVAGAVRLAAPVVPSLLLRRWEEGSESSDPVTFALRSRSGRSVVLYSDFPGIRVWTPSSGLLDPPLRQVYGSSELASSLRLSVSDVEVVEGERLAEVRLLLASQAIGAAAAVLEKAVEYAKIRAQFGRPIGSFQAVAHRLANMHRDIELARSHIAAAADRPGEPLAVEPTIAVRLARGAVESGIHVHGGYGITWEAGFQGFLTYVLDLVTVTDL